MARLNESAPSAKTLDASNRELKQQNHDFTQANAMHLKRIRALEGKISCLLSENLALRERVIDLQHEVNRRPGRSAWDNMGAVKGKLDAKLAELGGLMQELGKIQETAENHPSHKRKSRGKTSQKRSPDQRHSRNALALAEAQGGGEGRLPPIVEDKYFPRKTLDTEELLGIFPDQANLTDSPDLGPPPVAHFEEGDPVKFDPGREVASANMEDVRPRSAAYANLETRKRRRESSSITCAKIHGLIDPQALQPSASTDESLSLVQPLKSGAKRKLNVREDEAMSEREKILQDDGFMFNRRHMLADLNKSVSVKSVSVKSHAFEADGLANQKTSLDHSNNETQGKAKASTVVIENSRKALGPKSVNKDPTSPVKLGKLRENEQVAGIKEEIVRNFPSRNRLKDRRSSKPVSVPKELDLVNITGLNKKIITETPAPASGDIFSPVLSQPSATRPGSRDTTTPSDLNSEKSNPDAAGRGSRRSRGSVSYAEPNLRAKMRRPTKDLVDAVGAGERPQHLADVKVEEADLEVEHISEKGIPRTAVIKKEDDADAINSWKSFSSTDPPDHYGNRAEPISPLRNRPSAPSTELPTSVITDRRRRTVGLHRNDGEGANHPGAGSAIAALAAGSQKSRRPEDESRVKEKRAETHEIYDLVTSSPADGLTDVHDKQAPHPITAPIKTSRRHSSTLVDDSAPAVSDAPPGASSLAARPRERKRETLGSARGAGSELRSARSTMGLDQGKEQGPGARAERAAGRRRSMML